MPNAGEAESDWTNGQPEAWGENCVMIRTVDGPGWHDDNCPNLNRFLCETEL